VLTATLVAAAVGVWMAERARVLEAFASRAAAFVAGVEADLAERLRKGREDVLFLARSAQARAAVGGRAEDLHALEELLLAYSETRRDVFQARLISPDGRERVRIERGGARPFATHELQSKVQRPYFQDAIRLSAGQVYVSPLDLNVERGRIERPLLPTVRFATTVWDPAGRLGGVLVINQHGRPLLDLVARARPRIAGTLVLVDADGTYLSHPDALREWGGPAMLGTGHGLGRDFPGLAAAADDDTVWRGAGLLAARSPTRGEPPALRLILVAGERQALAAEARELLPFALGVSGATLLFATILMALWRQGRLAAELSRERVMRQELASREARLRDVQERLVATARLAALTESAATLAHELRNPLGAIIHATAQLRRTEGLDDDGRKLMQIVLAEGERLERTVSEFLALARRPAPRPESVDLGATARDVVALASHEPSLRDGMEISADVSSGVPAVTADPDEVRQILWNLLLNAGAATRTAGGHAVRVRVQRSDLGGAPAACIEVEDEGPGPPGEAASGTRAGLGLIVAAGIAARQGGHFEIVAREGKRGSCGAARIAPSWTRRSATFRPRYTRARCATACAPRAGNPPDDPPRCCSASTSRAAVRRSSAAER